MSSQREGTRTANPNGSESRTNAAPECRLRVETLTAAKTVGAPAYYRHMLDWNRKAVRVSVPLDASRQQIEAVEAMCAVAALGI